MRKILPADTLTPILAYMRVQGEHKVILESIPREKENARFSIIAYNPVFEVTFKDGVLYENGKAIDQDPFEYLDQVTVKGIKSDLPFAGGAIGFAGYDMIGLYENIGEIPEDTIGTPDMHFFIYESYLIFDHKKEKVYVVEDNIYSGRDNDAVRQALGQVVTILQTQAPNEFTPQALQALQFSNHIEKEVFMDMVAKAKKLIREGDMFQCVLSQRFSADFEGDPLDYYRNLRVTNRSMDFYAKIFHPMLMDNIHFDGLDCYRCPYGKTRNHCGVECFESAEKAFKVGPGGAGHYVKMVHNGIEYGDMQLIAETYFAMKHLLALKNEQMADIFEQWDKGRLHSYLIEITSAILRHKEEGGDYLLDNILDAAGQKGTGRWSVINSLQLNTPLDVIAEAVFARNLSAEKNLRVLMSKHYMHVENHPVYNYQDTVIGLESTLYVARLTGYAQGFALMCTASEQYGWKLNLSTIALLWRAGCIIRSAFLNDIAEAYHRAPGLSHLLLDEHFGREVMEALPAWKKYIGVMLREGLPVPVLSAALNYFLGLTTNRSPANMIQAMRDYFGAHTFERVDSPRGEFFHEHWEDNY